MRWTPTIPEWEARWVRTASGGELALRRAGAHSALVKVPVSILTALVVREMNAAVMEKAGAPAPTEPAAAESPASSDCTPPTTQPQSQEQPTQP